MEDDSWWPVGVKNTKNTKNPQKPLKMKLERVFDTPQNYVFDDFSKMTKNVIFGHILVYSMVRNDPSDGCPFPEKGVKKWSKKCQKWHFQVPGWFFQISCIWRHEIKTPLLGSWPILVKTYSKIVIYHHISPKNQPNLRVTFRPKRHNSQITEMLKTVQKWTLM